MDLPIILFSPLKKLKNHKRRPTWDTVCDFVHRTEGWESGVLQVLLWQIPPLLRMLFRLIKITNAVPRET